MIDEEVFNVKWTSENVKERPEFYVKLVQESFMHREGKLFWRERPREHFKLRRSYLRHLNNFAGKEAGHVSGKKRNTYYRRVKFLGATVESHILLWILYYGEFPKGDIDHIDGNGLNNLKDNLRDFDNSKNKVFNKSNKSGVIGVYWYEPYQIWRVTGGRRQIFSSKDFFEAVCFRKSWEIKNGYTVRNKNCRCIGTTK